MTDVQPNGRIPAPDYDGLRYGQETQLTEAAAARNEMAATRPTAQPFDLAAQAALLGEAPGDLLADTEFPDEPGTAGLPFGPGPGPEALDVPTVPRVARTLDTLAQATNNPVVASIAAEAAAQNL